MRTGTLVFLLGILLLLQLPALPGTWLPLLLFPLALLLLFKPTCLRVAAYLLLGFLWALLRAELILADRLEREIEGQTLTAIGQVVSLPEQNADHLRFEFKIRSLIDATGRTWPVPGKVRLSWYKTTAMMAPGEIWNLQVRLKRPHGFMNPGGFDYERWLFQHRIRATGYVVDSPENRQTGAVEGEYIDRLRQRLKRKVNTFLQEDSHAGLITALGLGDRSLIHTAERETLIRTGTNHLLAISGLHIGLVAGLVFFLARRAWSVGQLPLYLAAPRFAALAGILAAVGYALLAGLSIPTQRSFIMVTVVMMSFLVYRRYAFSQVISIALLLVLVLDPFAVMDPGMWLSFTAIAIIAYGMGCRSGDNNLWWRWGRVQLLMAIGLLPLLLLWFQQVSLVGILANLVAIPWVSLVVVPLVLSGTVLINLSVSLGGLLLTAADFSLSLLWSFLQWLGGLDIAVWHQAAPSLWALLAGLGGVIILLQPHGLPARWLGLLWLLPVILPIKDRPGENEIWITLLDVGQGLAAVVHTRGHTLVYDTGARFSATFNAGEAVLVPYLRQTGTGRIDTLVIGHGDNDHIGGARDLLAAFPETPVLTSVPEKLDHAHIGRCHDGQSWHWDGVSFQMLHPDPGDGDQRGNNQSCVLKISTEHGRILLTGDIEKQAENRLLGKYGEQLAATVLIAPHHGSKTSSTPAFIAAVDPELVLFPTGYRNRFNLPNEDIIARYAARDVTIYDSARHGAILIRLEQSGMVVESYRHQARRFWHTDI